MCIRDSVRNGDEFAGSCHLQSIQHLVGTEVQSQIVDRAPRDERALYDVAKCLLCERDLGVGIAGAASRKEGHIDIIQGQRLQAQGLSLIHI